MRSLLAVCGTNPTCSSIEFRSPESRCATTSAYAGSSERHRSGFLVCASANFKKTFLPPEARNSMQFERRKQGLAHRDNAIPIRYLRLSTIDVREVQT